MKSYKLKQVFWPIVLIKRAIDKRLYEVNLSCKELRASLRESISLSRRINDPSLEVGVKNSGSRDLWVQTMLANITPNAKLLDAGAGEQKYRRLCAHLHYFSQDNTEYDGKGDGQGGHVEGWTYGSTDYVCDITDIPVRCASFDVVLCTEVFEHLPDPVAAVTELSRVLRPGGTLLLTAPFCSFTHFSPFFYSTGFSRNWYLYHLSRLGFDQIELTPNGNFFEYLAQEIRRVSLMSSTYSASAESWRERLAILGLLRFLQKCSSTDRGSSDYSCYGWHVKALKANRVQEGGN